ncbi:MAG: SGNH/GDSL hydrolase family protein, partial [Flavitalea sp.]
NVLGRRFDQPVVNLGFSGNGRLEAPLIDLINEQDASLFVLDCMPNLHDWEIYPKTEVAERLRRSVISLREKHPLVPILLVEHCGGTMNVSTDSSFINRYRWASDILKEGYQSLVQTGVKKLFILTAAEIGMNTESTVDGTHPTDIGMQQYADAYEKKIRTIFNTKTNTSTK